ncbi:MAG: competence/damage-inducible protein A [Acidobacteriota bacterium]
MSRTAAALIIGNEILSGKIQDINLLELARVLRSLGVALRRVVIVPDELEAIAAEVSVLASAHDYLFTSGGVGPTHDDVTMEAVARAFDVPLVSHPDIEAMLRKHHRDATNEGHLRLARVPEGAKLVFTAEVPWPATIMRNVWILPGVPEVFRMKIEIIREHIGADAPFLTRAVFTGMEEAELTPLLDEIVARHGAVDVGSYPTWSESRYRTKVTFDARDSRVLERAVEDFLKRLPEGEPRWLE